MTDQEKYDHLFQTGNFIKYRDKIWKVYSYGNDSEFTKPPETCPWVRLIDFDGYIMSMIFQNGNRNVLSVIEPITEAGSVETYNLLFKTAEKKRMDKQQEKEQMLEEEFEEMCSPALSNLLTEKGSIILFNNTAHRVKQSIRPSHDGRYYTVVLETKGGVSSFGVDIRKEIINSLGVIDKPELYEKLVAEFKQADVFEDEKLVSAVYDDEKFKGYFRNALRLLDIQVDNPRILETIIRAYEGIKEKGGGFTLVDASQIFAALVKKYPEEVIMPSPPEKPEPLPEITPDYTPAPIQLPNSKI